MAAAMAEDVVAADHGSAFLPAADRIHLSPQHSPFLSITPTSGAHTRTFFPLTHVLLQDKKLSCAVSDILTISSMFPSSASSLCSQRHKPPVLLTDQEYPTTRVLGLCGHADDMFFPALSVTASDIYLLRRREKKGSFCGNHPVLLPWKKHDSNFHPVLHVSSSWDGAASSPSVTTTAAAPASADSSSDNTSKALTGHLAVLVQQSYCNTRAEQEAAASLAVSSSEIASPAAAGPTPAAGGAGGAGGGGAAVSGPAGAGSPTSSSGASDRSLSGAAGGASRGGQASSSGSSGTTPKGAKEPQTVKEIFNYAAGQAFKGGIAGASAQVLNVFAFMWLRTTMNYQYRYGRSTIGAIKQLYAEGGVVRFYRGLLPALMQSPLSRFGDTAANVGVLAALDSRPMTRDLPVGVKTAVASCGAAAWRFFLMPIDAWKTTKQVEGGSGLKLLAAKVRQHGFTKLYHGSVAAMGATWVGHYPWFFTHNYLSEKMPKFDNVPQGRHVRYGIIGFISSVVSDTCSNSIRVLKTTKQTSIEPMTYPQALREVLNKDGVMGLFFRGLGTRILTNGLQGMVFSVGWKAIQSQLSK